MFRDDISVWDVIGEQASYDHKKNYHENKLCVHSPPIYPRIQSCQKLSMNKKFLKASKF